MSELYGQTALQGTLRDHENCFTGAFVVMSIHSFPCAD